MALINCPECNKKISDKVKTCPFCGYPFESSDATKNDLQKVEITSVNIKSKNPLKTKKIIIGIITGIIVIAIGITTFIFVKNNNENKKYNAYIDNINSVITTMLDGGSKAEDLCNLTADVWSNSIYQKRDPETDKFTMNSSYSFYDDFNTALGHFYSDSSTMQNISAIEDNQNLVEGLMKILQNPPVGLENCYGTVTDLYTAYSGLTELAINPTGSYTTFTTNKTEKVNNFMDFYNKIKTQIPDKK